MPSIHHCLTTTTVSFKEISDSPALDAEVLLCRILQKERSFLRAWPEKTLTEQQMECFHGLVQQRLSGKPIAYIIGEREFWSMPLKVSEAVLIPRPDTEVLVEQALARIPKNKTQNLLDLGTGSGAIALSIAKERPLSRMLAIDVSRAALDIAQSNARHHALKNIRFTLSNWFEQLDGMMFDVIISNPPYIAADDPHLHAGDVRFEPKSALIANDQGLQDIQQIATSARSHLQKRGWILFEHGYQQQQKVQEILSGLHYQHIDSVSDYAGLPRVTLAQWCA